MRNVINILDGRDRKFPYLVESKEDHSILVPNPFKVLDTKQTEKLIGKGTIVISDGLDTLYRSTNTWQVGSFSEETGVEFPDNIYNRTITVIVPDSNPSVYTDRLGYAVDVVTRIGLTKIVLASKIYTSAELLSLSRPFQEAGYDYHQYITIDILDPWDLCYSDEYSHFREMYCYETEYTNNCGALIDIEITPVEKNSTDDGWIPTDRYSPGRNLILLSERDSDYMTLNLEETHKNGRVLYRSSLNCS